MACNAERLRNIYDELHELEKDTAKSAELVDEYKRLVTEAESLQQRAYSENQKREKRYRAVKEELRELLKDKHRFADEEYSESLADIEDEALDTAHRIEDQIEKVSSIRPTTGSLFVRLFLGRVNVRVVLRRDKERLRDEYNKFKDRTNILFVLIPLVWCVVTYYMVYRVAYSHWVPIITHVWLLYYYVSLALRENILLVNGSRIHRWWIYHHYVSAMMSIVVLTWPDSPLYRAFLPKFTLYFLYQALVQFAQAWYQKKRHYALRALGKVNDMDTKTTEGLNEVHRGLWVIVLMLLGAYGAQIYIGYLLFDAAVNELNLWQPIYMYQEEIQTLSLSICFFVLAVGNFAALVDTMQQKVLGRGDRMRPRPVRVANVPRPAQQQEEPQNPHRRQGGTHTANAHADTGMRQRHGKATASTEQRT